MDRDHDQMPGNKTQKTQHCEKVLHANPAKPTEKSDELVELDRFAQGYSRNHGEDAKKDHSRISELLKRVVCLEDSGLRTKEKIVPEDRPDASHIGRREKDLSVVSAYELVTHVKQPRAGKGPREGVVKLKRASKPASESHP